MTKSRRIALAVSAGFCAVALSAGCEDGAAKAREHLQHELEDATQTFHTAVMASSGAIDANQRAELRTTLNQLTSASTNQHAGSGQKMAANTLSADIHRALADAQLRAITELRSQNRTERASVASMVTAARRLQTIALALESTDVEAQIGMLNEERTKAEAALRDEQSEVATLEPPLTQLQSKIAEARDRVQGLREQENHLRRQASELGYSKGFSTYEQAISVRQQADQIETSTSHDELERDFQFEPQMTKHELRIEQIESLIASIDLAVEELRENANVAKALAVDIRGDLDTLVQMMTTKLDTLIARVNGELKEAVDAAAQDLSAAASKASAAAGSSPVGGNTPRLSAASAHSVLGQLHASWAHEMQQRIDLLSQLNSSDLTGMNDRFSSQLNEAQANREQAVQDAVAAYTSAADMYGRISGSGAASAMNLKHAVEVRIASLTGQAAPTSPEAGAQPEDVDASDDRSAPSMSPGAGGAESPEALAAAIGALTTDAAELEFPRYLMPIERVNFSSPSARAFAQGIIDLADTLKALDGAMQAAFGTAPGEGIGPVFRTMGDDQDQITGATLISAEGDAAQISVTNSQSGERTVSASNIDGRWYVGTPDDFTGGLMGEDLDMQMEDPATAAAAGQMFGTMVSTLQSFTARVQAGEFSSLDEAAAALGEAMMNAMGAMMPQP